MTTRQDTDSLDQRVLLHAPFGRDGVISAAALATAGLRTRVCDDVEQLVEEAARGVAVVIITQETLTTSALAMLQVMVSQQPTWSDLPILVFLGRGQGDEANALRVSKLLGNVTVLERPVSRYTMVSTAHAALRARRRQYEVRDLLLRREAEIRHRDQFLAMLGHELRNPLTAISNASELFNLRLSAEDALRRPLQIIARQTNHLARLVDDLLDVSRVTSGKVTLNRQLLRVQDALRAAIAPLEAAFRAQRITLNVNLGEQRLIVKADPTRLEQVFTNLLTNALKYTPAGGEVTITAAVAGHSVALHFADTGIGLAPDVATRIFDLFVQSQRALDRSQGGLGIGLTIVRNLLELHGGSITVTSPGVGKGSTFTATLPLADSAELPARSSAFVSEPTQRRHVLIVEDNQDNREGLKELLEELGYRVDAAADGEEGVRLATLLQPDVALVDIGLPTLDGYQVARAVREQLGGRIRLVALTGYGQPDDVLRAEAAGFDEHVTKPPNLDKVVAAVERSTAARREAHQP